MTLTPNSERRARRSRGWQRGVIVAVGLMLAAASPAGQGGEAHQAEPQQEVGDPSERAADILDKVIEPKRETADCSEDREARYSDLCAQWKAADAAEQAADAADWTVLIGWFGLFFGAITMGAAIAAAIYAGMAAKYTGVANRIAKNTNRPWLACHLKHINAVDRRGTKEKNSYTISWNLAVKNTGSLPAVYVSPCVGRAYFDNDGAVDFDRFIVEAERYHQASYTALTPGEVREFAEAGPIDIDDIDENGLSPSGYPYGYWAGVSYKGQYDNEIHCTVVCFDLHGDVAKAGDGLKIFEPHFSVTRTAMR